ncbi:sugar transferase [Paraconexibacter algicola]|uniref:Sugar transferase n=1 Tax=Paraconexibacter algicola TaxID=2133960 RepID=A0A2T4UGZ2_9ACTN|nr:sugar transferase [Paraconexibacter algicola]
MAAARPGRVVRRAERAPDPPILAGRDAPGPAPAPATTGHPRATWLLEGPGWRPLRPAVDLLALVAAVALTLAWPGGSDPGSARPVLLALPPLAMLALWSRGMYDRRLRIDVLDGVGPVVGAISVAVMVLVVVQATVADATLDDGVVGHAWVLSVLLVGAARIAIAGTQRLARTRLGIGSPALIVGAGHVGHRVARRLVQLPEYGLRPVGFLDVDPRGPEAPAADDVPVLGGPDDLEHVARTTGARDVVVAFSSEPDRDLVELVQRCERAGLRVTLVPRLFESMNDRTRYESLGGLPLLGLAGTNPRSWRFVVKHALDRLVAAVMLLLLGPLLLALVVAVKASSPGPVLFRQRRVGRDGRAFDLLKFRSMAVPRPGDAFRPGAGQAPGGVEGVDRRTAVGRFMRRTSLDELPQLLNVLRGEMSLVGPRPERPEFVELFVHDIDRYDERHRVRAGITGWAQIHGLRGQTSLADRVEWDNWYIEHWSLALDLKILVRTVVAAFRAAE